MLQRTQSSEFGGE